MHTLWMEAPLENFNTRISMQPLHVSASREETYTRDMPKEKC